MSYERSIERCEENLLNLRKFTIFFVLLTVGNVVPAGYYLLTDQLLPAAIWMLAASISIWSSYDFGVTKPRRWRDRVIYWQERKRQHEAREREFQAQLARAHIQHNAINFHRPI